MCCFFNPSHSLKQTQLKLLSFSYTVEGSEEYKVRICQTETSTQLNIGKDTCILWLNSQGICLLNRKDRTVLFRWPYSCIRRFNVQRKKKLITFEAGRRCESGPGIFQFSPKKKFDKLVKKIEKTTGLTF